MHEYKCNINIYIYCMENNWLNITLYPINISEYLIWRKYFNVELLYFFKYKLFLNIGNWSIEDIVISFMFYRSEPFARR